MKRNNYFMRAVQYAAVQLLYLRRTKPKLLEYFANCLMHGSNGGQLRKITRQLCHMNLSGRANKITAILICIMSFTDVQGCVMQLALFISLSVQECFMQFTDLILNQRNKTW